MTEGDMDRHEIMDEVYAYMGEEMPLELRLRLWIHLFFCPRCAGEFERLREAQEMFRNDFFPLSPDFEDVLMKAVQNEESEELSHAEEAHGFSFRGWVITGLVVFFSLSTAFLSLDFDRIAASQGIAFLLPMGITIGSVLTIYGAIFIGSHIKELSERFGLR
jgi:hypothetical protein